MPKQPKNEIVDEIRLAVRLVKARKAGSLTREQEAVLGNLAQASGASQPASSSGVVETPTAMEQLMNGISQLGHVPTRIECRRSVIMMTKSSARGGASR